MLSAAKRKSFPPSALLPEQTGQSGSENEEDIEEGTNGDEFHVMHLEPRPFRPFKTSEEYLYAMKEDLADWLNNLYGTDIVVDNFLERLENGVLLCKHANNTLKLAREFKASNASQLIPYIPERDVVYRTDVLPGTFKARDNVSNFISWCRALSIKECLLFETDDLVMRKNERSFILCLLEVARYGARYGMLAPVLVQMEQEIDAEIIEESQQEGSNIATDQLSLSFSVDFHCDSIMTRSYQTQEQRMAQLMGLHERVVNLLNRCTCPSQFPMIKVSDGKYRIGDTKVLIFVRILRNHVMVRVGGGWDTLEHYLDKHDPCRCRSGHRLSTSARLTMNSNKVGSPHMQVTYNRPNGTQNETPTGYRSSPTHRNLDYSIDSSRSDDSPRSLPSQDPNHSGRRSHDFSTVPNSFQNSNSRKPRSRSFDTASANFPPDESAFPNTGNSLKKISPIAAPRGVRKENSDPRSNQISPEMKPEELLPIEARKQSASTNGFQANKTPLRPACSNKIPSLQKSASKSRIPSLDHQPLKKSSKSQSTEDLYQTKYFLGPDDRWIRSRSSSSSPIHGAPRSTSMEQCSLAAISGSNLNMSGPRTPQGRRASLGGTGYQPSPFVRNTPGQYSFRNTAKSPETRRKQEANLGTNRTWSYHSRNQDPYKSVRHDWGTPPTVKHRNGLPSTNSSLLGSPQNLPKGQKARITSGSALQSQKKEKDASEENSSRDILRNLELYIGECESRLENHRSVEKEEEGGSEGDGSELAPSPTGSSGGYSSPARLATFSSVSRIPVLQRK